LKAVVRRSLTSGLRRPTSRVPAAAAELAAAISATRKTPTVR
jgi:hypothetical protein